ncbi:hypothetical protein GDO81_027317 [Engystomops pustulosus]|uniref:Uncharacterized protein n=1 Tax=Engystomops pustulosus TaxID=76066 RepID=A0AAV6Z1X5_ENGPU|nr:hypothetical protein GDO81_027317 [Engystomops pustulosus]
MGKGLRIDTYMQDRYTQVSAGRTYTPLLQYEWSRRLYRFISLWCENWGSQQPILITHPVDIKCRFWMIQLKGYYSFNILKVYS